MAFRMGSHAAAAVRELSAAAAEAARASRPSAVAEVLRISGNVPVLLKLQQRPWGALATLPGDLVPDEAPPSIGVVREAFAADHHRLRRLSDMLQPLSSSAVAVAAATASYDTRVIVDVYEQVDGEYRLVRAADDLVSLLHRSGLRAIHVPSIASLSKPLNSVVSASRGVHQSTNEVLMVAPTAFVFNAETAQDNTFMHAGAHATSASATDVTQRVLHEFAGLYHELADVAGIRVNLMQHSTSHGTPDACFPNNWFSTHARGEGGDPATPSSLVLYPMKCPNRAAEAREDIESLLRSLGLERELDLATSEHSGSDGKLGRVLEGTGSLVLDRVNGVAYVALSERADASLAEEWAASLGYNEVVAFKATDATGGTVYHTNVMMAVGTDVAVVCLESVENEAERERLRASLARHHAVVDISRDQMGSMCGNVLELEDGRGLPVLAMSSRAFGAFTDEQKALMRRHVAALHHAPIDTLEHIGGGSVRCTLGEIFRD